MKPVTAPGARHGLAWVLAAGLLGQPAAAAPDNTPPALPASVTASQEQLGRWVAAFNGWRSAKKTWSEETAPEAQLRGQTRLQILPTPTPLVSRQRWLDGRTLVVSSGLIALLDELALAEAAPDKTCLGAYGDQVLAAVNGNRPVAAGRLAQTPVAWPRLTALAEAGKAGLVGQTYDAQAQTHKAGPCQAVTAALLRSPATRARRASSADALALWLFTQQYLLLARLPPVEAPKPDVPASASASASAVAPDKAAAKKADTGDKQPGSVRVQVQVNVQVHLDLPATAGSSPATAGGADRSMAALNSRARQALTDNGWRDPQPAVDWLQRRLPFFDAGSSPPVQAPAAR